MRQDLVLGVRRGDLVHGFLIGPGKISTFADVQGLSDQPQGYYGFATRLAGQPVIGIGARQGLKRADLEKEIFTAVFMGMHRLKFLGVFNR